MSSAILPKEQLTAYQRWEMDSFDGQQNAVLGSRNGQPITLPTAEDIERLHQGAHAEGYATGLAEAKQRVEAEIQQLRTLINAASREIGTWEAAVAEDILTLALEVAGHVTRGALAVRRELILPVIREAMQQMPLLNAHARMLIHPDDAALVRAHLSDELAHGAWKVVEDGRLARGDCRIESSATQVDATAATRWKRIVAALGRDTAWIESGDTPATPRPDAEALPS